LIQIKKPWVSQRRTIRGLRKKPNNAPRIVNRLWLTVFYPYFSFIWNRSKGQRTKRPVPNGERKEIKNKDQTLRLAVSLWIQKYKNRIQDWLTG